MARSAPCPTGVGATSPTRTAAAGTATTERPGHRLETVTGKRAGLTGNAPRTTNRGITGRRRRRGESRATDSRPAPACRPLPHLRPPWQRVLGRRRQLGQLASVFRRVHRTGTDAQAAFTVGVAFGRLHRGRGRQVGPAGQSFFGHRRLPRRDGAGSGERVRRRAGPTVTSREVCRWAAGRAPTPARAVRRGTSPPAGRPRASPRSR